jgi:hypothetical protein
MSMLKQHMLKVGGGAAALGVALAVWAVPAWGASTAHRPAAHSHGMAMTGGDNGNAALTAQIAQARLATTKFATNLSAAKAAGYFQITPMMPNMGIHFFNPSLATSFDPAKPQILVYEHRGDTWQLGALEWVFPSVPKTPPLPNATFGFFPAACHYVDGTFIPHNPKTCPKTNPKTGSPFKFSHPPLITMHEWVWYPNPAGLYSSTNPLVTPFNGG